MTRSDRLMVAEEFLAGIHFKLVFPREAYVDLVARIMPG